MGGQCYNWEQSTLTEEDQNPEFSHCRYDINQSSTFSSSTLFRATTILIQHGTALSISFLPRDKVDSPVTSITPVTSTPPVTSGLTREKRSNTASSTILALERREPETSITQSAPSLGSRRRGSVCGGEGMRRCPVCRGFFMVQGVVFPA